MQLAISFLLHSLCVFYYGFVGFPIMACFLSCVCTLLFPCCFLQPSSIFVFLLSFHDLFSHLIMLFTHNSHNPTSVFMLLLKISFLLVPHYLFSEVCLRLSVLYSFLCLLTAIASRNKVILERSGFDTSVQISKASSFEKLTLGYY